ncbi:MAG: Maf family protein [Ignavibacteriales bacterium]|nr:Maf family protein [Ignavibacteriales bacterium]
MRTIILASRSPRRASLLRQIGLRFVVEESSVEEVMEDHHEPEQVVQDLSLQKARDVARRHDDVVVIGSDTIVVLDGVKLGKPADADEAVAMLTQLSGRTHTVYTGFAFVDSLSKKEYIDFEKTDVTFRTLRDDEIRAYVAGGSPMDKAGAYGIQDDFGAVFIERIDGCYYTVVGFPLSKFYVAMESFLASTS